MKVQCVLGPPGTGKSTYLVGVLRDLTSNGYALNDITFVSHTNAAANEILSRLQLPRADKVCTLHALCFRLQEMNAASVVSHRALAQFEEIVNVPISGRKAEDDGQEVGDMYLDVINFARNKMIGYDEAYYVSDRPGTYVQFQYFHQSYEQWKESIWVIDYTDMLDKYIQNPISDNSRVLIIDEAQDLSNLQWAVVDKLIEAGDHELVIIAGDDDQSIYIWGGADFDGMRKFSDKYGAEVKVLDQSYRIPKCVHTLSQNLINRVSNRFPKVYRPRSEEGVINTYGDFEYMEFDDTDTMVLARTHRLIHDMESTLIEKNIPYRKHGGRPGMLENRYATAIRTMNRVMRGEEPTKNQLETFNKVCRSQYYDLDNISGRMYHEVLSIPESMVNYYSNVDVEAEPKVSLSTIHAAKGKESDRVVVSTEMTPRISESFAKSPDEEIRVFYVAVTRAKRRLDIINSGGFDITGDGHGF